MSRHTISLIQMVSSQSVEKSLDQLKPLILEAAKSSPEAIFLPENFAALGNQSPADIGRSEAESSAIRRFVAEMAVTANSWIFAGTMPAADRPDGSFIGDGRVRAASLVFNEHGEIVSRYDKMHMFDVQVDDGVGQYLESKTFEAGIDVVSVESPIGNVGLTVCYDIRFPELYRKLFIRDVMAFSIPSAFTRITGQAHFELLMRARAVENVAFTIAACQSGTHDSGRETFGHTMVVDPFGEVVGCLKDGPGVLTVALDGQKRESILARMPVDKQRRIVI